MRLIQLSEVMHGAPGAVEALLAWCDAPWSSPASLLPPGVRVIIDRAADLVIVDDARPADSVIEEV